MLRRFSTPPPRNGCLVELSPPEVGRPRVLWRVFLLCRVIEAPPGGPPYSYCSSTWLGENWMRPTAPNPSKPRVPYEGPIPHIRERFCLGRAILPSIVRWTEVHQSLVWFSLFASFAWTWCNNINLNETGARSLFQPLSGRWCSGYAHNFGLRTLFCYEVS